MELRTEKITRHQYFLTKNVTLKEGFFFFFWPLSHIFLSTKNTGNSHGKLHNPYEPRIRTNKNISRETIQPKE